MCAHFSPQLVHWAVSDLNASELREFTELIEVM
jgi:hypothetical protein